jgi:hypothetical protein
MDKIKRMLRQTH